MLSLTESAVGSQSTVAAWVDRFVERTQVDEVIVTGQIFDHQARLESFRIAAEVLRQKTGSAEPVNA